MPLGNGQKAPFLDEVLSPSVVLDSTLSWKPQVTQVTKKVNEALFGLRFIKAYTTQALRKKLVEALMLPHFNYCSTIYMDITTALKVHLQRLLNTCIRYIYGLRRNARITPYRLELGWLRVETRTTYFAALIIYKI